MKNIIKKVDLGSIAEEVGIEVNDVLLSINGTPIDDIIDYKFLAADEEVLLEIEKPDGEVWEYEIEKDSVILLEQLRTIDKKRLKDKVCHLDARVMNRVNSALKVSLSLDT